MCVALISRAKERTVSGTEEGEQLGRKTRSVPRAARALRRPAVCVQVEVCVVCVQVEVGVAGGEVGDRRRRRTR